MRFSTFVARSLLYYWRTNLAVVAGAAVAVSVLAGAAMVGDSVRASLRAILLERLGNTHTVIAGAGFFREQLAAAFSPACPMIALQGVAAHDGRRAYAVAIYGVDERFWRFHGHEVDPAGLMVSGPLAQELGARSGDSILVRLEKPSAIPGEWLHGRKDSSRAMRLTVARVLTRAELGEFSLRPTQTAVRAVFVPLRRLQRELDLAGKVNTILVGPAEGLPDLLRSSFTLEDVGLRVRWLGERGLSLESEGALVNDATARVVSSVDAKAEPVFTYLANTIRAGSREIPYSLVTAIGERSEREIDLNEWAARDLAARPGDTVTLEYYVWKEDGRLVTESASFRLARILPIQGAAADRDLTPEYRGMTDAKTLADWDPPFPIDLSRIRARDEEYWARYRTTPKAFIGLAAGQKLWQSRFGKITSIRFHPADASVATRLRERLDPLSAGFGIFPAREEGLRAAQGATDFGEYFLYFSFFLVVSTLLLVGLFFRLGVEQRAREIGLLRTVGFPDKRIRNLFLAEGLALAAVGALAGSAGASGYAALILLGLRTWWVDAVGTRFLTLHVSAGALAIGAAGGVVTALVCVALTLRGLRHATPRGLISRELQRRRSPVILPASAICALGAAGLLVAAGLGGIGETGAFFGAAALLLAAALGFQWVWLTHRPHGTLHSVTWLGFRSVTHRPGRSVLSVSLIAFATFLIVALDAFRRDEAAEPPRYPLLAESILPIYHDLNSVEGREAANLPALEGVRFAQFRLRPGEDVSCLNLYQPRNPSVLGAPGAFIREQSDPAWRLLEAPPADGAIPAIVDANSLTYVLHRRVGDVLTLPGGGRLRLAGALHDSVFQRELVVWEENFRRVFPEQQGFRFFLIDGPAQVAAQLEDALSDYGFDVTTTAERLASFHRVENTYLSTFQALGALGLVLGTVGLAAVLLRNILESRRELALLAAVGYRTAHLARMVLAENAVLLAAGLGTGTLCAALAVVPPVLARGGQAPIASAALLLAVVLVTGLVASLVAIAFLARAPLLPALREE